jgi:putative endopeptidase
MITRPLLLLAGSLFAFTAAVAQTPAKPDIGAFGFDQAGMDKTVAPGDDFYIFANGTWEKDTPIPADRSVVGAFTVLDELSLSRMHTLFDEAAKDPASKLGGFYASFMDEATVESRGFDPLKPEIAAIHAIKSKTDYARVLGASMRNGVLTNVLSPESRNTVFGPVGVAITIDDKDPDLETVSMRQGGLGLPDRDYYLKQEPAIVGNRAAYLTYITQLLTLAGEPDAATRAQAVMAFETQLAQVHWNRIDSRDADKTYNVWHRADLNTKAPGLDWAAYLGASGLQKAQRFLVQQPSAVTGGAKLVASTPIEVLRDHLLVHTIDNAAPYLSKRFVDANFAYRGTALSGVTVNRDRWKRGATLMKADMGEAAGQLYVQRYFPPEAKATADQLVKNIIAAMDKRLQTLAWMDPATRTQARAKLAAFTPKIGYPDKWRDYAGLTIARDDLYGNVRRANNFDWETDLAKLGHPADRGAWAMTPMEINAYANPVWNEIVFPAAILQPPFFDPHADAAVNYGGIGAVIGHEMSHHFDDQGRKYDKTGRLTDWWTPQDVQRFTALTDKLVKQFDAYEPLPGLHVQGALTLGENMADLAGLTVAYDAYHASLGGKPAPVIDGLTGDQRFYLGWAQVWRTKYREASLRQRLLTDPHSPGHQRTWIVRNLAPWYDAYKPAPTEKMVLTPEQRVIVW